MSETETKSNITCTNGVCTVSRQPRETDSCSTNSMNSCPQNSELSVPSVNSCSVNCSENSTTSCSTNSCQKQPCHKYKDFCNNLKSLKARITSFKSKHNSENETSENELSEEETDSENNSEHEESNSNFDQSMEILADLSGAVRTLSLIFENLMNQE